MEKITLKGNPNNFETYIYLTSRRKHELDVTLRNHITFSSLFIASAPESFTHVDFSHKT